ncbi:MAG: hypothetical protein IKS39_07705 [Clostridia bacterium]|nr:hypothetical protein [Clostridia bacterium]
MKKIIASLLALILAFSCLAAFGFASDDDILNLNITVDEPKAGSAAPSDAAVSDELKTAYTASAEEIYTSFSSLTADLGEKFSVETLRTGDYEYYEKDDDKEIKRYAKTLGDAVAGVLWEKSVCFAEKDGDSYTPVTEFECGKAYTVFVAAVDSISAGMFECQKILNEFIENADKIQSYKEYKDAADVYYEIYSDAYFSNEVRAQAKVTRDEKYEAWKADTEGQAEYAALYEEFDKKIDEIEKSAQKYSTVSCTINGNEADCPVEDGFVYSYEFAPVSHVWSHSVGENSVSLFCENCEESYTVTADIPGEWKCSGNELGITASGELPEGFSSNIKYETADGRIPQAAGEYKACLELIDNTEKAVIEKTVIDIVIEHSYGDYVSDNNASVGKDGTKTAKCKICGAADIQPDPGTAKSAAIRKIKNIEKYNGKTLDYRSTVSFEPASEHCSNIRWTVSGAEGTQNEDGSFTVNQAKGDFTVYYTADDYDGKRAESEKETIKIKNDFFSKIIAFIVLLFNKEAYTHYQ